MTITFLIIIAILLRIVSNPLANVFQKQLTARGNHPLIVNFITYFILSLICLCFIVFIPLKSLPVQFWFYSILGGVAGAVGNGFLVKALEKGDLSILGPINSYKSIVGVLFGIILLGEIPNIWGVLGIVLIIYGSYFVLETTQEGFSLNLLKKSEIKYRIFALILTAIEAVLIKKIIIYSSTNIAFVSWCCFGAIFSFLLLFIYRLDLKMEVSKIKYNEISKYALLIVCIGTMQFSTNYAFNHMSVGIALSLFQLSIIVTVFLGHSIFKEKNIRKKLIGSLIMIVGSIVIILLKNS